MRPSNVIRGPWPEHRWPAVPAAPAPRRRSLLSEIFVLAALAVFVAALIGAVAS